MAHAKIQELPGWIAWPWHQATNEEIERAGRLSEAFKLIESILEFSCAVLIATLRQSRQALLRQESSVAALTKSMNKKMAMGDWNALFPTLARLDLGRKRICGLGRIAVNVA